MKGPERLLDGDASPFEAELLRSWHSEQPSARARQLALAIGAGAGTVIAASTSAKAAGALGTKLGGAGVVIKWFGVGVVAGLATSAGAASFMEPTAPARPVPAQVEAAAPAERASPAPAPAALVPAVDPSAASTAALPAVPALRREPASPPPSATLPEQATPPPPLGALAPQVALLDRARNALRSGNATLALQLIDEYRRTYPNGVLAQEAEVLGIDVLERQGQRSEAKLRARRFLDSHPTSAHADKLRRLAGAGSNP